MLSLERVGTWLFLIVVLAVGASVALSFAMNIAADDLRQEVRIASALPPEFDRTAWGMWLNQRFTSDVAQGDYQARFDRTSELDHRADRIRELAGAASLAGVVLMALTARPEARLRSSQSATSALPNTRSNGTV